MNRVVSFLIAFALLGAALRAQDAEPKAKPKKPTVEDIPALLEEMAKDDYAGMAACNKLAEIGKDAVPALVEATTSRQARVRYWSMAALSKIGDDAAVPALVARLEDGSALVRSVAVWQLQRWIDRDDVRKAVLERLEDENSSVRGWVLKLIQTRKLVGEIDRVKHVAMKDPDPEVRYDALTTATVLLGVDALPLLTEVWRTDADALVREGAVRCCALVEPRTPLTGDLLIRALRDKDQKVAEKAAELLRKGFNQYFAFDAEAPVAQRYQAIRDWRNWYEANKDKLEWSEERRRFQLPGEEPEQAGEAPAEDAAEPVK